MKALLAGSELCRNFGDEARSGGVVCRRFEDLDAVFESDTCDNLGQVICAFQPPPGADRHYSASERLWRRQPSTDTHPCGPVVISCNPYERPHYFRSACRQALGRHRRKPQRPLCARYGHWVNIIARTHRSLAPRSVQVASANLSPPADRAETECARRAAWRPCRLP